MVRKKKAMLKIVEAMLSILLIGGVMIILSFQNRSARISDENWEVLPQILNEVARNETLREKIITNESGINSEIEEFVKQRINSLRFEHSVAVCTLEGECLNPHSVAVGKEIFTAERVISTSSDYTEFEPKIVKVYMWRK